MMHEELHMILEDQRRRQHMREADDHRRVKALRQSRGEPSLWQRITRGISQRISESGVEDKASAMQAACTGPGCEPAISESI